MSVVGNCLRIKCDSPKCDEATHIHLPNPIPSGHAFMRIYLNAVHEQGWSFPVPNVYDKHTCYKHGVGARLNKKKRKTR